MVKSDFYLKVYDVVREVPTGKVTTYGAIARFLGVQSGARMVGYAMNNVHHSPEGMTVPAHRVINRQGLLTGRHHFEGDSMKEFLVAEGIEFIDEYQVNMDKHFWDPNEEDINI